MSQQDPTKGWYRTDDGLVRRWNGSYWEDDPLDSSGEENPPPGWYRVPKARMRYWDGNGWTDDWAPVNTPQPVGRAKSLWRFATGDDQPTATWEGPGYNPSFDSCAWRINSRCFYPRSADLTLTVQKRTSIVWNGFDRGWCPRVKWADQEQCPMFTTGPNSGGAEPFWSFDFPAHGHD